MEQMKWFFAFLLCFVATGVATPTAIAVRNVGKKTVRFNPYRRDDPDYKPLTITTVNGDQRKSSQLTNVSST